jgi:integrase/recombinase XerD
MTNELTTVQTSVTSDVVSIQEYSLAMWLQDMPEKTSKAYSRELRLFESFTGKPTHMTAYADLVEYEQHMRARNLSDNTIARSLAAIKAALTHLHTQGLVPVNVGTAKKLPKIRSRLAERILSEHEVLTMLDHETNRRNHALIRFLYSSGARVSEAVNLQWRDVQARGDGQAQVTLWGKGGKERTVLISAGTYQEMLNLDGAYLGKDRYVFQSKKSKAGTNPMDVRQAERIVQEAAKRVGIGKVSPHWMRHAHASHALDNGESINVVKETLGHTSLVTTSKYTHARPNTSSSQRLRV